MTLLVNEIHVVGDLRTSMIVFAADTRITYAAEPPRFMKKVFRIPYLQAGIGYYGLAQVNPREYFSSWIPNAINAMTGERTPAGFAERLCERLNREVDKSYLSTMASGLHICGYNADNCPELWHICNHTMRGYVYTDFATHYGLSEDFLARHALKMGFDGTDPAVPQPFVQYYINGDVRPFHSVWRRLDEFLFEMFSYDDFRAPQNPTDNIGVVKWKMRVISSFYKKFARKPIIGGPIDVFFIRPAR
jgi:hypothetical protein